MATPMVERAKLEMYLRMENAAIADWAHRLARNDPDWGIYFPGEARPRVPRWRRLLRL